MYKMYVAQHYIDKNVDNPMDTNCAPLVVDLFLFCCERDFTLALSDNNQSFLALPQYI